MDKSKKTAKPPNSRANDGESPPNLDGFTPQDDLRAYLLELYARVLGTSMPTDQFVWGFLRRRKQIRGGARGFLAATLYALLRKRTRTVLLWRLANGEDEETPIAEDLFSREFPHEQEAIFAIMRWLREDMAMSRETARETMRSAILLATKRPPVAGDDVLPFAEDADFIIRCERALAAAPPASDLLRSALASSIPPEFVARWRAQLGSAEADRLAIAMTGIAPLDVRVAPRHITREAAREHLLAAGLESVPTIYSPDGLRLAKKANLSSIPGLEGAIEVQDEGSQLVSLALGAGPGWRVLDACAGAGGKSLHLAEIVGAGGRVCAHDTELERLEVLEKRRETAGYTNIELVAPGTAGERAAYDAVLIDAPCTALGRMRREPTLAWRAPLAERIREAVKLQRECLDTYAPLVRPGGILVYAVCTIELEETEEMVRYMAEAFPDFTPAPLPEFFPTQGIPSQTTLLPSQHGTDAFFIAKWKRNS